MRPIRPETNLVLIGMPGVGKSTAGVLLAKRCARDFVDTDVLIQAAEGRSLQVLLDALGPVAFRALEERCILALDRRSTVIATGGSAVYSDPAMRWLRRNGVVVHLDLDLDRLAVRLGDLAGRGVVREPGQTLAALHAERAPLYRRHADLRVDCAGLSHEQVVDAILSGLAGF